MTLQKTASLMISMALLAESAGGLLLMPSSARADLTSGSTLRNGLVGHWTFDGNDVTWTSETAGTVTDVSGNGSTGTITNMNQSSATTPGKIGQAFSFDGSSALVSTSITSDTVEKTFAAWIYPRTTGEGGFGGIFGKDLDFSFSMCDNDGTECPGAPNTIEWFSNFSGAEGIWHAPANSIVLNQWNHVAVTYSESATTNDPIFYINGTAVVATETQTPTGSADSAAVAITIGAFDLIDQFAFDGRIDDARIYNRILTASEVKQLARLGAAVAKPPNNLGLVGYWSFNEATSTQATDFSGNARTGTFDGTPTWTSGRRGAALDFNGTNAFVRTPLTLNNSSDYSFSLWFKARGFGSNCGGGGHCNLFALNQSSANAFGLGVRADTQVLYFSMDSFSNDFLNYSSIVADRWYHAMVTRNGSSGLTTLYVDGVQRDQATRSSSSQDTVNIGAWQETYLWYGLIDEVRVYNRVVGAEEVAALAGVQGGGGGAVRFGSSAELARGSTLQTGLVGHWTFDGEATRWTSMTAGTAFDLSGNGSPGTLTNVNATTARVPGKLTQGLRFDGADDFISLGDPSTLEPSSISICVWAKRTGSGDGPTYQELVNKQDFPDSGYTLEINDENTTALWRVLTTGSGSTHQLTASVTTSEWHHYCGTFSAAAGNMHLYIDGVLAAGPLSATFTADNTRDLRFGVDSNNTGFFEGIMDDVRMYNRALTASEVKQLYNLGTATIAP